MLRLYPLIYVVILLLLVSKFHRIWWQYAKVLKDFEWRIDEWFFLYAKTLYQHRDSIYDYEGSVDVLYATKHRIMAAPHKSYVLYYEDIKKDLTYVDELLGGKLVDEQAIRDLDLLYATLLNIRHSYKTRYSFLLVWTVWLYSIWKKPLLD